MKYLYIVRLVGYLMHYKFQVNVIKSLYYSLKYGGCCIIGKAVIQSNMGGVVFSTSQSVLTIGLSGTTTTPTQLILDGRLRVSGNVDLYKGAKIVVMSDAVLTIYGGTYINEYSRIFCRKRIFIGAGCAIAWNVCIMDTDMHKIYDTKNVINPDSDVYIGDNVWIGANSFVGKGTTINEDSILGAYTIASKEVEGGYIHTGIPSHPVRRFTNWD